LCAIVDSDKIHAPPLRRSLVALNGRSLRFKGRSAPCEIIADPCTSVGQLPVVEYAHFGGTCSITGGYMYRGSALPALVGNYFYADFCAGSVHSIQGPSGANPGDWTNLLSPGANISSFGQDARGELYIVQLDGPVWRIVPKP